jgi:hypothetical protein
MDYNKVNIRVKKYNTCHDELFLKGKSGLYCLLPFERLDEKKGAVFKVGLTSRQDFASQIEQYHTYYPLGLYCVFFLACRRLKKGEDRGQFHRNMEKQLIDLKDAGGKMLVYPSRPSKRSEWFYTSVKDLKTAFTQVQAQYGGLLHEFHLDCINKRYDNDVKKIRNKYVGEIIYAL